MITLDDRPGPPAVPQFSRELEEFLLDTARTGTTPAARTPHRRARYVVAGLAAAAVAAGVAVGISYSTGSGPSTPTSNPPSSQHRAVHIHLAAFSVDTNPGGTVTLTLTQGQLFDPNAVRRALEQAGVPAVVTVGSICTVPGRPSNGLPDVISRPPGSNGANSTTITPSAIPAGEKLSFGYLPEPNGGRLFISLVPDNAKLTCSTTPPAPPRHGSGSGR